MVMGYLIFATSAASYKLLLQQQLLCLPSVCTLRKLTRKLSTDSGLEIENYLRLRTAKLDGLECNVLLMIDEIYLSKRIEYSGGQVYGLTEKGEAATTMLCFMVKSIKGNYRDVVSLFPIHNLTADKLKECYEKTMFTLRSVSLNVVGISVDNAAVNRKFYALICEGNLQTHVVDPVTGQPIFLFFDPVHNIKNIYMYNNFRNGKIFVCPFMPKYFPNGCIPNFDQKCDQMKSYVHKINKTKR